MNIFKKPISFNNEQDIFVSLLNGSNFINCFGWRIEYIRTNPSKSSEFLWELYKESKVIQQIINYSFDIFLLKITEIFVNIPENYKSGIHTSWFIYYYFNCPIIRPNKSVSHFIKNNVILKTKEITDHILNKKEFKKFKKQDKDKRKNTNYINKKMIKKISNRKMRRNNIQNLKQNKDVYMNKYEACDSWGWD
jgi:hypothetical protein